MQYGSLQIEDPQPKNSVTLSSYFLKDLINIYIYRHTHTKIF